MSSRAQVSALDEPRRDEASEILIKLIQRHAERRRHGLIERVVRPQGEQQPTDAFRAVLHGNEVEHRVRPVAIGRSEVNASDLGSLPPRFE